MIEQISIDLTNKCGKGCSFCYNKSSSSQGHIWKKEELVDFIEDCINNGVEAISFGGGEPLEYPYVFEIIEYFSSRAFVSITTNGILLDNEDIVDKLKVSRLDKLHISIHNPEDINETERILRQVRKINSTTAIIAGINLLIKKDNISVCKKIYQTFLKFIDPRDIILVPMRFQNTPNPRQFLEITDGKPFQSPSCLLKCSKPSTFCTISWNKKAHWCSFAPDKEEILELTYSGLLDALSKIKFRSCSNKIQ